MNLSNKIKTARQKTGKTQKEVAKKINISRTYYSDVEKGRYLPSLKVFTKLAVVLNLNMNDLKESVMEELR